MRIRVKVKQDHIDNGEMNDAVACPIALSLGEMGFGDVEVQATEVKFGEFSTKLPLRARRFIGRFDAGKPVKPFAFIL